MALIVPNSAELLALKALIGVTAQTEDFVLCLFTGDITPAETDTAATYTAVEASGAGYARKALAKGTWDVAANPIVYPSQSWVFTGALDASAIIYGYFILRAVTLDIVWAERFDEGFKPLASGDALSVIPQLGAD